MKLGCVLTLVAFLGGVAAPVVLGVTLWPLFILSCVQIGNSFAGTPWLNIEACNALSGPVTLLYLLTVLSPLLGAAVAVAIAIHRHRRTG